MKSVQCIGEAFGVDPSNQEQVDQLSVKPATLQTIFDVFIKTRDKVGSNTVSTASTSKPKPSSDADKAEAEKHKQTGNSFMSSKKYDNAIDAYSKAIALDPTNPVYFSNRAAAHSSKGDHLSAIGDAEQAISADPQFTKAYHRLGYASKLRILSECLHIPRHAQYSLGDFKSAASAFERGLKLDPTNTSLKTGLQNAQTRIVPDDDEPPPLMSELNETSASRSPQGGADAGSGGMADILSGLGGFGGGSGGGMPDLASLMNNPQMMAMAQQLAANGGLASLMQNPSVANMVLDIYSLRYSHVLNP